MKADLYNMTTILEKGDMEKWMKSAFFMKNTPEFLPMPDWYEPETAKYLSFIKEDDGNIIYPESGDKLEDVSYGVYLQIPDISSDEIDTYVARLRNIARNVWKSNDSDIWDIEMADYNIRIRLEEGTATLLFDGQDVTFVPLWYLEV